MHIELRNMFTIFWLEQSWHHSGSSNETLAHTEDRLEGVMVDAVLGRSSGEQSGSHKYFLYEISTSK